jgi:hypothetical protein
MSEVTGPKGDRGERGARGARGRQGLPPAVRYTVLLLFSMAFLLAAGSSWLAVRAVQGEIRSRASVVQLCHAGNESRAQQITLWTHLVAISAPPAHETAAQKAVRARRTSEFLAYVGHVFAPRNCSGQFGG